MLWTSASLASNSLLRSALALVFACVAIEAPARPLIPATAEWRYALVTSEAPVGWHSRDFDDSSWPVATGACNIGFGGYNRGTTPLDPYVGPLPVRAVAVRRSFQVRNPAGIRRLLLRLEYSDGLVAWLNGREVLRLGFAPGTPVPGAQPPLSHSPGSEQVFDLTPHLDTLTPGANTLAIIVATASAYSPTLFLWPELRADFLRGPFVQDVSTNRAVIVWQSPIAEAGQVEIADAAGGATRVFRSDTPAFQHEVVADGLAPGTMYRYRAGWNSPQGVAWSEESTLTTFRGEGDVDFLVIGDTGTGSMAQLTIASAMGRENADLVLHTGDVTYGAFAANRADLRCFSIYEPVMRRVPFFVTFGNHDFWWGDGPLLDAFRLPTNSMTGTEHYYSFDHGDVHFVSLFVPWLGVSGLAQVRPDGSPGDAYRWLANDLARSDRRWKVAFFHTPLKTSGPHAADDYEGDGLDIPALRGLLLPLFARHGVQLVFSGHDHFWERFAPTNGVHIVVTGGGGGDLYPVSRRDPATAQVHSRHHYVRAKLRGDEMTVEAVEPGGAVFDRFAIRSRAGSSNEIAATWHTPGSEPGIPANEDGNRPGEQFDLVGPAIAGVSGRSANPGQLFVNQDADAIHLGLRDVALWPGQSLALFVGSPRVAGRTNALGTGASKRHPLATLDLAFAGFEPAFVCLLGDERADETDAAFARGPEGERLGQGVFRMDAELAPVGGARLRQFNRSPEGPPVAEESNADFVVVSLPRALLGVADNPGTLHVAAVAITPRTSGTNVTLEVDTAFVGAALASRPDAGPSLAALDVRLDNAPGEDSDGDGYTNLEEHLSGTDPRDPAPTLRVTLVATAGRLRIAWRAIVGRTYEVEAAPQIAGPFAGVGVDSLPRRATAPLEAVELDLPAAEPGARWFRVRETR